MAQESSYVDDIERWHQQRIDNLTREDSWLSLAGLFWLEVGQTTFGSDASNDIRFPKTADAFLGTFFYDGSSVIVDINESAKVTSDNSLVNTLELRPDTSGSPTILRHKSLLWYVIIRGDRVGIRLKDTEHENLQQFQGIDRFPVEERWNIKARLLRSDSLKYIKVPDVLGNTNTEPSPGTLIFEHQGREYQVHPLGSPEASSYFLIFSDATSGDATYGGGRYVSVPKENEQGYTTIDFNKAYNPPCAFTPYATCPLPPPQNQLPFAVRAGEKRYAAGHH